MKTNLRVQIEHRKGRPQKGFSLIATVTILVLLSLIAIGLLSLSAVTVRSSASELTLLEARANARLSLALAIGELQKQLGPDQRVSAEAGVFDRDALTPEIEGVQHPHWVGVWSTRWEAARRNEDNKSPWVRNDTEGGLSDRRWEDGYDRETQVLNYLVSGNEGGKAQRGEDFQDAVNSSLGEDGILLLGEGTLGEEAPTEQQVYARRVRIYDGKADGLQRGSYAWWVSDLGVKANVAIVDPFQDEKPDPQGGGSGYERMLNALDGAEEKITGLGELEEDDARRTFTKNTLSLAQSMEDEAVKARFHDITTNSRSVLVNVRQGRLLRDLTVFLDSRGRGTIPDLKDGKNVVSWGISPTDNLIGPANAKHAQEQGTRWQSTKYRELAPTWALVRDWAQLGKQMDFGDKEADWVPPSPVNDSRMLRNMNDGVNVYDGGNLRPAGFTPMEKINLAPVMVEGSMFYNMAAYPDRPGATGGNFTMRICTYPRIVLWNPYNIQLECGEMMASIFVNGNKEIEVRNSQNRVMANSYSIPFGRGSTRVGAQSTKGPDTSPGHYVGWMLFNLPATTMEPGETLVFSPTGASEYDIANPWRNTMSATVAPDPANYFYQDMNQRVNGLPGFFIERPGGGASSGGDNYAMSLKDSSPRRGRVTLSPDTYSGLQQIVYINPSLQAGGSDEFPVQWSDSRQAPVHILRSRTDRLRGDAIPDTRTRDGFRLRWWDEMLNQSNVRGSGTLSREPYHLQTAAIGSWNPRAAYFCRTPWDNVTNLPPHFYGAYTRDLFDERVSWNAMMPRPVDGKMKGHPFGPPLDGPDQLVLFEIPRSETQIASLGYLRHLKVSEFGWHPSYAIGNSLADPRVGRRTTSPVLKSSQEKRNNGWNQYLFGWGTGDRAGRGPDYWASLTRQIVLERPDDHYVVFDMSYETNFNLWDNFFLSTGSDERKKAFLEEPVDEPLPNSRYGVWSGAPEPDKDILDFHRAAAVMSLEGGFNVHSISVEAWKSLLATTSDTEYGGPNMTPFPRMLNPPEGEYTNGDPQSPEALAGFRSLDETELELLAQEIVREVKERAPFFGLSDFVNRRLRENHQQDGRLMKHGEKGPLEAAIQSAALNQQFEEAPYKIKNDRDLRQVSFDNMRDSTRLDQTLKPNSVFWGVPGYLTQGDILQVIGSSLRPRSDTFLVRGYGESVDARGNVLARAWCEAVVQRTPEPINPDNSGLNPVESTDRGFVDFGRRFRQVSFRWLSPDEV